MLERQHVPNLVQHKIAPHANYAPGPRLKFSRGREDFAHSGGLTPRRAQSALNLDRFKAMTETEGAAPAPDDAGRKPTDYSKSLYLPQTDFPMRAGLPKKEPELLAYWREIGLYERMREAAKDRAKFVLHDGPPYANGTIHIGHALNKILKDLVARSQQMLGKNANYVPGWDCHGLPIEWKIEEQYRAKGRNKDEVPINEFRRECRAFAEHWVDVQREEFKRLGVAGDWDHPYLTMSYPAEAADRPRDHEIRRERAALSRLEAGDVERRRKDRAGRGRGRIRRPCQRLGLCGVSFAGLLRSSALDGGLTTGRSPLSSSGRW